MALPRTIKWRGQFFLVTFTASRGQEDAAVSPPDEELRAAIISSLKSDPGLPLRIYFGFEGDYLFDDPKRGEA